MKIATDLHQARVLADILPLESADMHYAFSAIAGESFQEVVDASATLLPGNKNKRFPFECACSLSALLDYLSANFRVTIKYLDNHWELDCRVQIMYSKELVDACYEMVLKLYEQKLL